MGQKQSWSLQSSLGQFERYEIPRCFQRVWCIFTGWR
ncbi:hypothetical protein RBSH_01307 [Rhodopirellula baltica SH28]|uniref:Uncharacterized protein n=2 Tax=Rhodopirellula baltica TaxID=265606 RepID=F2AN20_RHOBT|nr:hypothetical protein RBWH47_03535 [Rhodopirellula baltica WH47]EKK03388.1 hypothetical protein RBSH_01307 [Rhodopirellula baltica SH28]